MQGVVFQLKSHTARVRAIVAQYAGFHVCSVDIKLDGISCDGISHGIKRANFVVAGVVARGRYTFVV